MGTKTLDVEVRPHGDGGREMTSDANTWASIPIVDVMIPPGGEDQVAIPPNKFIYIGVWTRFIERFSDGNSCCKGPRNFYITTIR